MDMMKLESTTDTDTCIHLDLTLSTGGGVGVVQAVCLHSTPRLWLEPVIATCPGFDCTVRYLDRGR